MKLLHGTSRRAPDLAPRLYARPLNEEHRPRFSTEIVPYLEHVHGVPDLLPDFAPNIHHHLVFASYFVKDNENLRSRRKNRCSDVFSRSMVGSRQRLTAPPRARRTFSPTSDNFPQSASDATPGLASQTTQRFQVVTPGTLPRGAIHLLKPALKTSFFQKLLNQRPAHFPFVFK